MLLQFVIVRKEATRRWLSSRSRIYPSASLLLDLIELQRLEDIFQHLLRDSQDQAIAALRGDFRFAGRSSLLAVLSTTAFLPLLPPFYFSKNSVKLYLTV